MIFTVNINMKKRHDKSFISIVLSIIRLLKLRTIGTIEYEHYFII